MPYVKITLHLIWSTKYRLPLISKELKPLLLDHIKKNSIEKGIYIDRMNCVDDHIHMLISLGTEQTVAKVIQLIKGESSNWVNKQQITRDKFEWQDEYIALSVSESAIPTVRKYIDQQEEHHRKVSFQNEYDNFLVKHRFAK